MPAPISGQASVVTGVTVALSTTPVTCTAFSIKAPLSNAYPVFLGAAGVSTANGYQLDPGDSYDYERIAQNGQPRFELYPSDFFAAGTTGDKVTWLGSP